MQAYATLGAVTETIDLCETSNYDSILASICEIFSIKDPKTNFGKEDPIVDGLEITIEIPTVKEFCEQCPSWKTAYGNGHGKCLSAHYSNANTKRHEKYDIEYKILKNDNLEMLISIMDEEYNKAYFDGIGTFDTELEITICEFKAIKILKHFREQENARNNGKRIPFHFLSGVMLDAYLSTGYDLERSCLGILHRCETVILVKDIYKYSKFDRFLFTGPMYSALDKDTIISLIDLGVRIHDEFYKTAKFKNVDKLKAVLDAGTEINNDIMNYIDVHKHPNILKFLISRGFKPTETCYNKAFLSADYNLMVYLEKLGLKMPNNCLQQIISGKCTYRPEVNDFVDDDVVEIGKSCENSFCNCGHRSKETVSKEKRLYKIILSEISKENRKDFYAEVMGSDNEILKKFVSGHKHPFV